MFIAISENIFAVKLRQVVVMMFTGVEMGVMWLDKVELGVMWLDRVELGVMWLDRVELGSCGWIG